MFRKSHKTYKNRNFPDRVPRLHRGLQDIIQFSHEAELD